jgi:hypothetical protein
VCLSCVSGRLSGRQADDGDRLLAEGSAHHHVCAIARSYVACVNRVLGAGTSRRRPPFTPRKPPSTIDSQ